jgi:hypothetical protein
MSSVRILGFGVVAVVAFVLGRITAHPPPAVPETSTPPEANVVVQPPVSEQEVKSVTGLTPVLPTPPPPPASNWSYRSQEDQMGKGVAAFATVRSSNTLTFDFPYNDPQHATLMIRKHPRMGKDVVLSIEHGQFMCRMDSCSVLVRFDDGEATTYSASEPTDNSTEVIFISNFQRFYDAMKKAKRVRISTEFYQEGQHVLDFNIDQFDESKMGPATN